MSAEGIVAKGMRNEREQLLKAPARIAELDELIAFTQKDDFPVKIAPGLQKPVETVTK